MSNYKNIELEKFSQMFGALSNPNRLKIFLKLLDCCGSTPCCATNRNEASAFVGELGEDLGIVASTVSHHIKELNRAGLIHLERQGKNVSCWVNPDALGELKEFFDR
jgi:ArsR family transcriptional regulator